MHYISSVEIENFRSCQNVIVELSPFTPLVGYNNAGKSNIILAVQWLIKGKSLENKDFFNDSDCSPDSAEVIGTIEGITEGLLNTLGDVHKSKIEKFIDNSQLKIKRSQSKNNKSELWVWNDSKWNKNPTGIDNAIKVLFPEPIRIGAMDNATEDVSKSKTSTTIGKLLSEFISPIKDEHETKLKPHFDEIQKSLSAQGDSRLSELNKFDTSINEKIKDFFPDMSLKIDIKTPSFDEIFKDGGTIRVYENGNEGRDCSAYGHGAQRAIQMALIRHLADIKSSDSDPSPTTLLLIDEPELYLHPFAIEQTREALKTLSKKGYQVLFSTHSPQMITAKDAQNTLLIRKESHSTKVRKRLGKAIQETVPDSNSQEELLFSLTHSSQILFSEIVVLAEGKTEQRLFPFLFEKVSKKTLGQKNIAFIQLDGVGNTAKSMKILHAMDLPAKAIVDLDYILLYAKHHGLDDKCADFESVNSIFQRLEIEGKVSLKSGSPKKFDNNSEKPFSLLAQELEAKNAIENIHNLFKSKNVWVWKQGTIENILELSDKNVKTHSQFKTNMNNKDIEDFPFYDELRELVEWLSA